MRIFYSGSDHASTADRVRQIVPNRLVTVHGDFYRVQHAWVTKAARLQCWLSREVMVDSGAFSAFHGRETDYTVDKVSRLFETYTRTFTGRFKNIWLINLDEIPGAPDRRPTSDEIARALAGSDRNFEILTKRFGPIVIPVFHRLESWERLEIVKQQAKFIAAAPGGRVPERVRIEWAKRVLSMCEGWDVHGLATTGERIMTEVGWYSVDSAAWVRMSGFGAIYTAASGALRTVLVSSSSPHRDSFGKHYDTLTPEGRAAIKAEVEGQGFDMEVLREKYDERAVYNAARLESFIHAAERSDTGLQHTLFDP